jgi:4-hydroxy-3-polyprenylbenzoate decarboxylase
MPAAPGFYHAPRGIDDLVDFMVARILDHLGVEHRLSGRWGDAAPPRGADA